MHLAFIQSIHQIEPAQWDSLWVSDYPFTRHAFLAALEDSRSTCAETGWQPLHALLKQDGKILGAVPLFVKDHSYGEYVFDWAWADAYAQHQLHYYPKFVNAIPFTPSTGPRIALSQELTQVDKTRAMQMLQQLLTETLIERGASGWHSLFPDIDSQALLEGLPLIPRYGCQFHWFNQGFEEFDEFLANFSSRKRKNLKRERQKVAASGLEIRVRSGEDIGEAEWTAFYELYQRTYLKRSGNRGYLRASFFHHLAQTMPEQLLLVSAHRRGAVADHEMVAGAFYLRDQHTLYGRYWGALEDYDALHFEACYYRGIEYAIQHGLDRFDPGAQGEHKIQRGFTPVRTCSYHWLAEPRFAQAIDHYCAQEARHVENYIAEARRHLPFREEVILPPAHCLTADL